MKRPRIRPRVRIAKRSAPLRDKHDLYELAAQSPARLAAFLRGLHPRRRGGLILGEDFCGSGAIARAWAAFGSGFAAVGVDKDASALRALASRCEGDVRSRITLRKADVLRARNPADVIAALNFPLGYFWEREGLLAYLAHARARLRAKGVFVADTYGGRDAFSIGRYSRALPGGVRYEWEQRRADPATARVFNAMHFREGGRWRRDVFTYHWRLWSIPELRDAMTEVGFRSVEIHEAPGDAAAADGLVLSTPLAPGEPIEENYVVYVVGRR